MGDSLLVGKGIDRYMRRSGLCFEFFFWAAAGGREGEEKGGFIINLVLGIDR